MDKVVHFEIPSDNLDRAEKFYVDVFEWKVNRIPMGDEMYLMVNTVGVDEKNMPVEKGAINGGIMKRSKKGETSMIVINVASIDSYLEKVKAAGGRVVKEKAEVMDMGFYARIADTEGNGVGLWEDVKKP